MDIKNYVDYAVVYENIVNMISTFNIANTLMSNYLSEGNFK